MNSLEIFRERLENYLTKKEKLEKQSNLLSNFRLITFISGASLGTIAFINGYNFYAYTLIALSLLIFIWLVFKHEEVTNKVNNYNNMVEINNECLQRMEGDWISFKENGREYENPKHPYIDDLDVFGHASLFQYINIANTYHGREFLRNIFEYPNKDILSIKKRQNSTKELAMKLDFCQGLQCEGMNEDFKNNPEKLFIFAENKLNLLSKSWFKYLFFILPAITVGAFIFWYFNSSVPFFIPLSLLAVQIIINVLVYRKANIILNVVYTYKTKIKVYQSLLKIIEKEQFTSGYLKESRLKLIDGNNSASAQINKLDRIVGLIAFQYNPIIHFVVNNLFFWDIHCVFALEKWKENTGNSLRDWIYTVGTFESLCSLALISQLNPEWCYPEFDQSKLSITAKDIGHPLIFEKNRIVNNVVIEDQINIITGSNMSGKTTFLRTIGLNLVLAYAGAPVCARSFKCSLLDVFTSMRVTDDLSSGISTFYAELLRIKMIIDYSKEEKPMLFLIDEVFRGTNSNDRVVGAKNVLMNLNKDWVIGLISTHDFELCEFEDDKSGRIKNYHFIETYLGNEIKFDYIIRSGRCRTTNAKYLMKMVGIEIADVVGE